MAEPNDLTYTDIELRSYLPSGWNLTGGEGSWDAAKRTWTTTVIDDVDFDWPVEVSAREAAEHGRLEALNRAMDRTWRGRLGWRTKGLGI